MKEEIFKFIMDTEVRYTELEVLHLLSKFTDYLLDIQEGEKRIPLDEWFEIHRKKS